MEVNRVWLWLVGNYWALTTVATVRAAAVTSDAPHKATAPARPRLTTPGTATTPPSPSAPTRAHAASSPGQVGFGDVTPSNAAEVAVAMAVEVMGVMFFGLLISSIRCLPLHPLCNLCGAPTQKETHRPSTVRRL
jgi:hypothetical protein